MFSSCDSAAINVFSLNVNIYSLVFLVMGNHLFLQNLSSASSASAMVMGRSVPAVSGSRSPASMATRQEAQNTTQGTQPRPGG